MNFHEPAPLQLQKLGQFLDCSQQLTRKKLIAKPVSLRFVQWTEEQAWLFLLQHPAEKIPQHSL